MSANPPINHQWPDAELQQDPSHNYALTGKIMLSSIIILFVVVVVLVILHLYARWYLLRFQLRRRNRHRRNSRSRSTRIVFYVDNNRSPAATDSGLDSSVLKSIPVFVYSPESDGSMPECAVCLSEFEEGEKGRVLPKCKHCFHTECIDMWFGNHSTCPLCRSTVEAGVPEMTIPVENHESVPELGSSNSPIQRDGDVRETTTSFADRMKRVDVRIDVPNRNELALGRELTELRLNSPSQGFRSPGSRLLSLKRIMTMSRKSPVVSPSSGVGTSSVPVSTESDLESARYESTQESSLPGSIR